MACIYIESTCYVIKGQGINPNHDHPENALAEGQNRQSRRFFDIWCPETLLKYPLRGATVVSMQTATLMQFRNTFGKKSMGNRGVRARSGDDH